MNRDEQKSRYLKNTCFLGYDRLKSMTRAPKLNAETNHNLNPVIATAAIIGAVAAVLTLIVASIGTISSWQTNQPNVSISAGVYEEGGSEFLWVRFYNQGAATTVKDFGYIYRLPEDNIGTWLPSRLRNKAPSRLDRNSSLEFAITENELSYFPNRHEDSILGFGAILANNQAVWLNSGAAMDFFESHK